jgi:hypothetical protein
MKDFLTAQEVKNLKAAHRLEKDRRRADRIKAILLLNEGLFYQPSQRFYYLMKPQSDATKNSSK